MKKINNKILIEKEIANIVSSRDLVFDLRKKILNINNFIVELDFANVVFVSRSAVHEFLSLQDSLMNKRFKKRDIRFINTSVDVRDMFRIVAANIAIPNTKKRNIDAKEININTLNKSFSNC